MFKVRKFQVRLVDGPNYASGRLEVYHRGVWGTVCDDHFSQTDAEVVCRQLGFIRSSGYWSNAYFGQGSGPIWLDNVRCTGNESSLAACPHNGLGIHNCGHYEDVGVSCYDGKVCTIFFFVKSYLDFI